MKQSLLLNDLESRIHKITSTVENELVQLSDELLNHNPQEGSWSILQCLEHLNRYGNYYLPELNSAIKKCVPAGKDYFQLTWLGKKSIESVNPAKVKKAKTFKRMDPAGKALNRNVINHFLEQQQNILNVISRTRDIDLNKRAVRIEFMKFLKLNVGETLLFIISHEERHLAQALRISDNLETFKLPV